MSVATVFMIIVVVAVVTSLRERESLSMSFSSNELKQQNPKPSAPRNTSPGFTQIEEFGLK